MNLGQEIKRIRKESGVSQKEMAKKLGLSEIHYCGIENGKRSVTIKVLEKVAKKLKKRLSITLDDLKGQTYDEMLDKAYGKKGTPERTAAEKRINERAKKLSSDLKKKKSKEKIKSW